MDDARRRRGLLTRHQVHSSAWQRLFPDVYACAGLTGTHELRTAAVPRFLLPGAVATARSAAVLWDAGLAAVTDEVETSRQVDLSIRGDAPARPRRPA